MKTNRLHHVGMVVSPEKLPEFLSRLSTLGVDLSKCKKKRVDEFKCMCYLYGQIEIVVPDKGSTLEAWCSESMTPLHHICIPVEDVRQHAEELRSKGVPVLGEDPVQGVGGILVNFVHPLYMGLMVEIAQLPQNSMCYGSANED